MLSPGTTEAMTVALEMIRRGVIEVREDGTVWKLRNLNPMPFRGPHRTEVRAKVGYLLVSVWLSSRQYLVLAHRLVWTALRGPIPPGMEINHLDGNKHNNHPSNLEVVTPRENCIHAYRTGLNRKENVALRIAPQAAEMRRRGMKFAEIGAALGVCGSTAFRAVQAAEGRVAA